MRATLVVLVVLAGAGCAGGDEHTGGPSPPASEAESGPFFPSWMNGTYTDGTISLRYPSEWIRNETRTFGRVLSNATDAYSGFVGIRYLERREWKSRRDFGRVAARALRPPDGDGIRVLATQAARLGGRAGAQAQVFWVLNGTPVAYMRVFGVELASGEVALVTFATDNHGRYAATFRWVQESIAWSVEGPRTAPSLSGRRT